jgi:hypothetical protein
MTGVLGTEPLREAVDARFRTDAIVADALRSNLKARTKEAKSVADRVETAFKDFSPSSYSADDRARPTYLAPGDKLPELLEAAAKTGAESLRRGDSSRGIRLMRGRALNRLIKKPDAQSGSALGTIKLNDLVEYVSEALTAGASTLPTLRVCDAEEEAERRLKEIESHTDHADDAAATDPVTPTNGGAPADTAGGLAAFTEALVKSKVDGLMGTVVPPEAQYSVKPPHRADDTEVAESLQTFELRDGPSDVTSYHDFNSLQIAFPNVWAEVFDGELEALGKQVYNEYVQLKIFAGYETKDTPVSTVSDLSRLIGEIQALSQITQEAMPSGSGARGSSTYNTPAGKNDLLDATWDVLSGDFLGSREAQWLLNPLGAAIGFLGSLFASMQQITWEFLEQRTRLPGGIDEISVGIEKDVLSAGTVEIVLKNLPTTATWKGIDFYELDRDGRPVDVVKITNDPRDKKSSMQLRNAQVKNGMLLFGKEIEFGQHKAHYFLVRLDEKLKDRARATFTWEKDK